MPKTLPLESFEIEGYRAIRHLQLPELGRVTLIVGSNNAGKTTLLDAIRLYMSPNPRVTVHKILFRRSNLRVHFDWNAQQELGEEEANRAIQSVRSLFHGYYAGMETGVIRIGQSGFGAGTLVMTVPWQQWKAEEADALSAASESAFLFNPHTPLIEIERDGIHSFLDLENLLRGFAIFLSDGSKQVTYLSSNSPEDLQGGAWGEIAASGNASHVEGALRAIMPDLERVHVLTGSQPSQPFIAFQLKGVTKPVPLRAMGDGVSRVFAMAVALVQARDGVALLDEVENGLHYTVQDEVWEAIFRLAELLNVQVVATTHSWDTIVGFQYAAAQTNQDGMLYRLDARQDGRIDAVRYTEREVEIAAEQRIEVR